MAEGPLLTHGEQTNERSSCVSLDNYQNLFDTSRIGSAAGDSVGSLDDSHKRSSQQERLVPLTVERCLGNLVVMALLLGKVGGPAIGGPEFQMVLNAQQYRFFVKMR